MAARAVGVALLALTLAACGGDDAPDDGPTTPYASTPYASTDGSTNRIESPLADWSKLFEVQITDHMTVAEAKTVLGLDAEPELKVSDIGSSKYRWKAADGSRRQLTLYLLPFINEENTYLNAKGYKNQVTQGKAESVDVGQPDVWAVWRVQKKDAQLMVFTKTHIIEIRTSGMPPEEGKALAAAAARHIFESNA